MSAAVLSVLLLIPVWLLAARTHASTEHWLAFGFFDKRWLLATFLLGTIGSMLVVTGVSQVVRAAGSAPGSWQAWARAAVAAGDVPTVRATPLSWRRTLALSAGAVALAAFFFAPPWHVALSQVDAHETPMLGGVQAIANGAVPYIGPSAVQYGPGSELIHYLYLDKIGGFNVEAFRQSTVLIYWLAATIFFLTILLRVPTKVALLACLASVLVFPTLQMIAFQPDGSVDNQIKDTMEGVWGWPNAMRYVGVFAVAMVFPAVARRPTRRSILLSGAALGLLWGLTCFIAQENLAGGAIALGALAALLGLSQTIDLRSLRDALVGVALGFAAVAAAVLGYYAANGDLGRFLDLYYLVPSAVAAGYSDTAWFDVGGWGRMYYALPFLLGALCLLSLVRLHPLRVARRWEPERVLLVSALVATSASYLGALTRADPSHLINASLAVPVALVLAIAYLPRLLDVESIGRRRLAAVALVAASLAMLPLNQLTETGNRIRSPLERFSYEDPAIEWQRADPDSVAAERLGSGILHRPGQWCCSYLRYPVSVREFAAIVNRLHQVVGDRRTYVANFIDDLYPGGAYFLADLKPAPILFEPITMAINQRRLDEFLAYFEDHISEVQAIVAVYPDLREVKVFKAAYPDYRETRIPYSWGSITVLTR